MHYIVNRIKMSPVFSVLFRPIYRTMVYFPRKVRAHNLVNSIVTDSDKTIWYCGDPQHPNLGDIAQKLCILDWINRFFPTYRIVRIPAVCFEYAKHRTLRAIKSAIGSDDIFVFQSGYTMTDHHPDECFHQIIPSVFPDNYILVMPQTVKYSNLAQMKKTAAAYANNKKLVLLARDEVSYKASLNYFKDSYVDLYPDIVTSLIGTRKVEKGYKSGVLFCLRNDSEKLYSPSELNSLIDSIKKIANVTVTDTTKSDLDPSASDAILRRAVNEQIDKFSSYQLTVTDRFHGMVFSLIAGTPVVVIKTTDHKVTAGANWFGDEFSALVHKADSLKEAEVIARNLLKLSPDCEISTCLREQFYFKLPKMLKSRNFPIDLKQL